jgi:hypothetical protein
VLNDAIRRNALNHPKHTLPYELTAWVFFSGEAKTDQYFAAVRRQEASETALKTGGVCSTRYSRLRVLSGRSGGRFALEFDTSIHI